MTDLRIAELHTLLVARAILRVTEEGGWRSWSAGQYAEATGLPRDTITPVQIGLIEVGLLQDTHGVIFGEIKVQHVDPEWERRVWDWLQGGRVR